MSNKLANGTVLPSGLLGMQDREAKVAAFNRSYRNTGLKAGFVTKSYDAEDEENTNHLCTLYDVLVIEQFENKGTTPILYKKCLSTQGFGSVPDFLEYTLRPMTSQGNDSFPVFKDQDGAIVLIQCLDNIGERAVVIGSLIHPDRDTTITSTKPQLSGEYNGVNVQIANDGSCMLTFKGATDDQGDPTDSSQGNTTVQIEKDGSFQIDHEKITFRLDHDGTVTIKAEKDLVINCDKATVTASGDVEIKSDSNANMLGSTVNLGDDNPPHKVALDDKVNSRLQAIENALNNFITGFNTHFHGTAAPGAPTTPPPVPANSLVPDPSPIGSSKVNVAT